MKTNLVTKTLALALIAVALTADAQAMKSSRVAPSEVAEDPVAWGLHKKQSTKNKMLFAAITAKNAQRVDFLLKAGALADAREGCCFWGNCTPLHRAVQVGSLEIVNLLLAAHADVDALEQNLATPLHWAAAQESDAVVQALIAAKANVNVVDIDGKKPLYYAIKYKREKNIVLLRPQTVGVAKPSSTSGGGAGGAGGFQGGDMSAAGLLMLQQQLMLQSIQSDGATGHHRQHHRVSWADEQPHHAADAGGVFHQAIDGFLGEVSHQFGGDFGESFAAGGDFFPS